MADIFVSYKKEDFDAADRIVKALKNEGMSVWWDDGLTPKESWDIEIEREIVAASTVVVLWSTRSYLSEWVRREAHFAQDHGKLVPVMVETTELPIAFTLNQTVNLVGWDGDRENRQWRKLLTWVADLVAAKPGDSQPLQLPATAPQNRFRDAIGYLGSGDPIVDGVLVNASTPAGTAFRDGEHFPVMRIVPRGSFLLGAGAEDPDRATYETPQVRVNIQASFAIGVFPITISEYQHLCDAPPSAPPPPQTLSGWAWFGRHKTASAAAAQPSAPSNPRLPITQVTFDEAQAYIQRLSATTKESYRLPSEAEWEYACRAGTLSRYFWGDTADSAHAAFGLSAGPVEPGKFPGNGFGLHDMHGNVREWAADLWHDSYELTPTDGRPSIEGHAAMRVVRGGGWSDSTVLLRSAARMRATQSLRSNVIGFRVARTLA
jgi:formylglycine-generating enzyme required for sulfatase activity